jgi:two-component system sensor histidine kinase KdpD
VADPFLDVLRSARQGRFKVFLGMAAGVGKTVAMLRDARRLRAEGLDVVVAFVETHGRAETEAELGDLPRVARRTVEYRAVPLRDGPRRGAHAPPRRGRGRRARAHQRAGEP